MARTRRILDGLLATICLLSTAGCTSGGKDDGSIPEYTSHMNGGPLYSKTVPLPDGRQVDCIVFEAHYKGGISCDWDHAVM